MYTHGQKFLYVYLITMLPCTAQCSHLWCPLCFLKKVFAFLQAESVVCNFPPICTARSLSFVMARVSADVRAQVVALRKVGKSYDVIAATLKLGKSTNQSNIVQKHDTTGEMDDQPRSGRPRKTTAIWMTACSPMLPRLVLSRPATKLMLMFLIHVQLQPHRSSLST